MLGLVAQEDDALLAARMQQSGPAVQPCQVWQVLAAQLWILCLGFAPSPLLPHSLLRRINAVGICC